MTGPRILLHDLENSPGLGYFWGKTYQTNIIDVVEPARVMSFAAKWVGAPKNTVEYRSTFHDGRQKMLERYSALLDEADAVVSYNGVGHDTPHAMTEFLREGISLPSPVKEIDLLKVTRGKLKLHSNRLNSVLHEFDLGSKVKHEGLPLWFACMAGDEKAWARFRRYNIGDVVELEKVYQLYRPIIPAAMQPNVNLWTDTDGCPSCGGMDLNRRGYRTTRVSRFQQYQCKTCGTWSSGKTAITRADKR